MKATLYGLTKNKNDIHVKSQLEKMLAQVSEEGAAVIDGANIAAESIYGKSIVAGSIEATQIKAGAITSDHITANGIVADKIKTGILRSTNGASWLNLNDGTFSYANGNFTFQDGKMVVRAHTIELGGEEVPTKTQTEQYANNLGETLQGQIDTSIKSTEVEYYSSTSSTSPVGGVWSTTAPEWQEGRFMWSRTKITPNKGSVIYKPNQTGTNISGAKGGAGATGQNATTYWINASTNAIKKDVSGAITPNTITFSGFSKTGTANPVAYAGRFIIQTSTDGVSYADAYTSTTNQSSYTYTIPTTASFVKARYYLAGGTTVLLDEQTIPVLVDADGLEIGGRNLISSLQENWEAGWWSPTNGELTGNASHFRTVDGYKVIVEPNKTYTISGKGRIVVLEYHVNGNYISRIDLDANSLPHTFTTNANTGFLRFYILTPQTTLPPKSDIVSFEFQLEKGNIATNWTEAPEDVELTQNKKVYNPVRYIRDWLNGSSANTSNHWCEIKVNDTNGTNVAKGKTVTTNGTATNLSLVTDGIVNATYSETDIGKYYVEIDLGSVYNNIASVSVWHYYPDNRTYYETRTEVSEDRVNWYPIFDSLTEGTYAETESGKTYPNTRARAEALISAYNMSQQLATSTSKVVINGGNITAGTVKSANSDSWINLDNGQFSFGKGNMVWNGSNLTVKGNIDASSINTGTLAVSRIPNLSADKITSGSINAARIAANTITATHIASRTITTDRIATNAITANEISVTNLSALSANLGNVTAGTIKSTNGLIDINLNTGVINLGQPLTINFKPIATKEDVDSISVGGRNLLLNSEKEYSTTSVYLAAYILDSSHRPMENGQTYTLSFELKSSSPDSSNRIFINNSVVVSRNFAFTTEWVRHAVTFTYTGGDYNGIQIYPHLYPSGNNTTYARNFKLEKGNKATDWTEAPEDVEDRIGQKADIEATNAELEGIKSALESTVSVDDYEKQMNEYSTFMETVQTDANNAKSKSEELDVLLNDPEKGIVTNLGDAYKKINSLEGYLSFDGKTNTLTLARTAKSSTKIMISDTSIDFMDGTDQVASITNQYLKIQRGIFASSVQVSKHIIMPDDDDPDHLVFTYLG